jgi:hypothetical protein
MTKHYSDNAASTARVLAGADPDATGTLRFQYECTIFTIGKIADLIAFGQSLELKIDHRPGRRGLLARHGILIVTGNVGPLRALHRAARRTIDFEE